MKTRFINTVLKSKPIDVDALNSSRDSILVPNLLNNALVVAQPVFCAAILIASKKVVTIKTEWIKDFDMVKSLNNGLKSANAHIVFYGPIEAEPDFSKSIAADFDEKKSALYVANICKFFGK